MATTTERDESNPGAQTCYTFTLILCGVDELSSQLEDALYEAGCSDGALGMCAGVPQIVFDRYSNSLEAAVTSAIKQVQKCGIAGLQVARVVTADQDTIDNINAVLRIRQMMSAKPQLGEELRRDFSVALLGLCDQLPESIDETLRVIRERR